MDRIWRLRCSPRWKHFPQPSTGHIYNLVSFWSVVVRLDSFVGTRRPRLFFVRLGTGVGSVARERGRRGSDSWWSSDVGEASQEIVWGASGWSLEVVLTDASEGWRVMMDSLGLDDDKELCVWVSDCSSVAVFLDFLLRAIVVCFLGSTQKCASSGVRRFSRIPACERVCGRLGTEWIEPREVLVLVFCLQNVTRQAQVIIKPTHTSTSSEVSTLSEWVVCSLSRTFKELIKRPLTQVSWKLE